DRELLVLVDFCGIGEARALLDELALDARIVGGRRFAIGLTRTNRVEREVDRDAIDPSERLAATIETIQRAVGTDESFLCHVFGFRSVAQQVKGEAIDALLVSLHQRPESVRIACARSVDELTISPLGHEAACGVLTHADRSWSECLVSRCWNTVISD